jgi:sigma-70-like protein
MPRRPRYDIDEAELLRLYEQEHLSQYEIAQQLGLSRSTVRNRLVKYIHPVKVQTTASRSTNGQQPVDTAGSQPKRTHWTRVLGTLRTEQGQQALRELIVWWHERTAAIKRAHDARRKTERMTVQVERRWGRAIRRKATQDDMTISQIVNEAFRQYFGG